MISELDADQGERVHAGQILARLDARDIAAQVGVAKANVAQARANVIKAGASAARARAIELLNYLEVGHRKHAIPAQLSGGEAQRVAIARALANSPRIILADEPTAPLDSQRARIIMDLLRKLAIEQNAAIIVVTHDEMILDRFDHIFRLRDGRLEFENTTGRLSENMKIT